MTTEDVPVPTEVIEAGVATPVPVIEPKETTSSKKKPRKKSDATKSRGVNYNLDELEELARNWGEVTQNSIAGTDQTSETFWKSIKLKHDLKFTGDRCRDASSLQRTYLSQYSTIKAT